MKDPKRLLHKSLRLIFTLAVDLLTIAEEINVKLGFLRIHTTRAHYVGDLGHSWLEKLENIFGIEPPNSAHDLRVNIIVAVATIQVVLIILVTATSKPETFLLIPTFCLYAAAMLAYRQYRLRSSNCA